MAGYVLVYDSNEDMCNFTFYISLSTRCHSLLTFPSLFLCFHASHLILLMRGRSRVIGPQHRELSDVPSRGEVLPTCLLTAASVRQSRDNCLVPSSIYQILLSPHQNISHCPFIRPYHFPRRNQTQSTNYILACHMPHLSHFPSCPSISLQPSRQHQHSSSSTPPRQI